MFLRMAKLNISAKQLSTETGISTGNISDWKNGRSMPTSSKLIVIADYLDCSVDYLLGRTDVPEVNKKTAYVHHMDEQYSVPYIAAYGEGDVTPKGKFTDEDIEELKKRGRNH